MNAIYQRFLHLENHIHHQLVLRSVAALRIALGAVFLGFGVLKFFPGVSPAEELTRATTDLLTFGLIPGEAGLVLVAMLECFIGLCLLSNRLMRLAIWLLAMQFVGILSPVLLLPGRLFAGPSGAPTLEGQYVLKDVILVAAGLVVAAASFRGGRMVRGDLPPATALRASEGLDPGEKLRLVLEGVGDDGLVSELCQRHQIAEAEYYAWREASLVGATQALAAQDTRP